MAFAATPFNFWRGTLKVKFQVVASQYHRGRLAVFYEPNSTAQDLITAVGDNLGYNSRFVEVFDLQELDGVCVEIPWASSRPFLRTKDANQTYRGTGYNLYAPAGDGTSGGFILGGGDDAQYISNGYFELRVVNRLTSAINDPPPVEINMFVSMEDLEVAFPRSFGPVVANRLPAVTPSLFVKESKETVVGDFKQDQDNVCHYLVDKQDPNESFRVFFGEDIRSFRPMLKRFNAMAYTESVVQDSSSLQLTIPIYPTGWLVETGSYQPQNSVQRPSLLPLLDYLRYAFIGMRGSVRFCATIQDGMNVSSTANTLAISIASATSSAPSADERPVQTVLPRNSGTAIGCYSTNGIISAEVPYYTPERFFFAFNPAGNTNFQWGGSAIVDDGIMSSPGRIPAAVCEAVIARPGNTEPPPLPPTTMGVSWAAGDDFTLIGYQAPPCLYYDAA
jgi:hypothetical protein